MEKPNKARDPLIGLKYKGYCWAHTPPGENVKFDDLVSFAKFFLCKQSHRLWKDSIWEEYTDEEILIEYFAYLFAMDEVERKKFEVSIDAGTEIYGEDIFDWLDRKVKENQEEMKAKLEEMPEKVSFSPDSGKDQEE
jgi:hypothetical protein